MWQLFACLATIANLFVRPCDSAVGENAQQHAIMCNLAALAATSPKPQPTPVDPAGTVAELEQINFTTSYTNWTALFDLSKPNKGGKTFPENFKTNPLTKGWQTSWEHWYDTAAQAKAADIGTSKNTEYPPITDTNEKQAAHNHIRALTTRAKQRQKRYDGYAGTQKDFGATAVAKLLRKALYGGDGTAEEVKAGISFGTGADWDNSCSKPHAGKSIAGDFVCLCHNDEGTEKTCGDGVTSVQFTGSPPLSTLWGNIRESCHAAPVSDLSQQAVMAVLSEFRTALKIDTSSSTHKVLFGTDSAGSCDGSSTKVCIDYAQNYKPDGAKSWETIPWVQNLLEAAKQTEDMHTKARSADAIATEIGDILAEAKEIYAAAVNGQLSIKTITATIASNQPATATKNSGDVNQKAKEACKQHKAKKDCEEKGCKWNGTETDEPCEAKPAEQANQGAEGAAATEKCKGKSQTDCKSPDCKWEGETCKDSSFILNKQFALSVVSAAFAALLFLKCSTTLRVFDHFYETL
uniref:Variant surface glycoprotein 1125.453 n=1 Tax=Trypanosoma brucei TaxID=5691 RepID=A0A1J0R5U9_9TRYP|nr:variant surface glycoprotein 1125.453 [Trypanosoma brucei]